VSAIVNVTVPDIGDLKNIPVIDILVKAGDLVTKDTTLVVLESDKATLDVPSPENGTVNELKIAVGDKVSVGSILLTLDVLPNEFPKATKIDAAASAGAQIAPSSGPSAKVATIRVEPAERMPVQSGHQRPPHASPSIRRMSRELGIDLSAVRGTGPRGRIVKDDLQRFVKAALSSPVTCEDGSMSGLKLAPWPTVDFSKFGKVERTQLSKLRKLSGTNLSRNANVIPHVTNFEDADITDLDAFRCTLNLEMNSDVKLTVLPFLIKAAAATLARYAAFNGSLDGDDLIL
jgi:pyruvate dehydrogenase E2 component (dihydrolipoamide acetyltransferase)